MNKKSFGLSNMRTLIHQYKNDCKKKNRGAFDLTEEQFKELTQQDCHYCGAKPSNIHRSPEGHGYYTYNGLDRVDNNKGYTIDNVVPCCRRCNMAKRNLTLQDYKDWIKRSYNIIFS